MPKRKQGKRNEAEAVEKALGGSNMVRFNNVTIDIGDVPNATCAYDKLCELLGGRSSAQSVEFTTDTYEVYSDSDQLIEDGNTITLWPED